jgi:UDP-N-acetylglucosamine 2-epimerase (non-hydrolysing)
MESMCRALKQLADRPDVQVLYPVHPNPSVREVVDVVCGARPNITLIEPVDYEHFVYLMQRAHIILTDSGGIQEEAPSFGVPVVVMRNHTERGEGVEAGFASLAGQQPERIETMAASWPDDARRREKLRARPNPYGDGRASQRIDASLLGQPVEVFGG